MSYTLTGAAGRPYTSEIKGQWGGYKPAKIYGRLDCPSALRAITRGGYARYRVFFADEAAASSAGYRPCGVCCPSRYRAWKAAQPTPSA
jgi:methylphosphotriester-DNA--protein-cysteine methyltransferase